MFVHFMIFAITPTIAANIIAPDADMLQRIAKKFLQNDGVVNKVADSFVVKTAFTVLKKEIYKWQQRWESTGLAELAEL